jgi:hypothetical protein
VSLGGNCEACGRACVSILCQGDREALGSILALRLKPIHGPLFSKALERIGCRRPEYLEQALTTFLTAVRGCRVEQAVPVIGALAGRDESARRGMQDVRHRKCQRGGQRVT